MTPTQMIQFTRRFNNGEFRGQRFGQAWCNTFGVQNPSVFYATDRAAVEAQIWVAFVR